MNIWHELGLAPGSTVREIKLAYARRLKQVHPEDDAAGFQRLRQAYELALRQAPAQQPEPPRPAPPRIELSPEPPAPPPPPTLPPRPLPPAFELTPQPLPEPPPPSPEPPPTPPPLFKPAPRPPPPAPPPPRARPLEVAPPQAPQGQRRPALPVPPPLGQDERLAPAGPLLLTTPPPAQAAQQLLRQLDAAAPEQWPALLAASRRRPGWENLDFQAALEQALLAILAREFDARHAQLEAFARHYDWQGKRVRLQAGDSPAALLLTRRRARQRRIEMQTGRAATTAPWRAAFELLLGPVEEQEFRRFARWAGNLKAMRELLAHLHQSEPEVLRHEADPAAVQWWTAYLQGRPQTWNQRILLVLAGLLLGPIVLAWLQGVELVQQAWLRALLLPLLIALPYGIHSGVAEVRRRRLPQRAQALRQRWRSERRPRRIAQAVTALALLLSLGAGKLPGFGLFPAIAIGMLGFWTDLGFALVAVVLLAWPLQLPLSLLLARLPLLWPKLSGVVDTGTLVIGFPHWLAMYLARPFQRACVIVYRWLFDDTPDSELRLSLFTSFGLAFALFIAAGLAGWLDGDSGKPAPPIPPRRPMQIGPPAKPMPKTATPPAKP